MPERFILQRKLGNAWTIVDTSDGSMVCIITGGGRGEKKTLAMAEVMLTALNHAVAPRGGKTHDGHTATSAAE